VATRVDSRTVLDVMGADHLLGKLFLLPGLSRLIVPRPAKNPMTTNSTGVSLSLWVVGQFELLNN
jgi:hypothetical protein